VQLSLGSPPALAGAATSDAANNAAPGSNTAREIIPPNFMIVSFGRRAGTRGENPTQLLPSDEVNWSFRVLERQRRGNARCSGCRNAYLE
jgi:hypothetical protein